MWGFPFNARIFVVEQLGFRPQLLWFLGVLGVVRGCKFQHPESVRWTRLRVAVRPSDPSRGSSWAVCELGTLEELVGSRGDEAWHHRHSGRHRGQSSGQQRLLRGRAVSESRGRVMTARRKGGAIRLGLEKFVGGWVAWRHRLHP